MGYWPLLNVALLLGCAALTTAQLVGVKLTILGETYTQQPLKYFNSSYIPHDIFFKRNGGLHYAIGDRAYAFHPDGILRSSILHRPRINDYLRTRHGEFKELNGHLFFTNGKNSYEIQACKEAAKYRLSFNNHLQTLLILCYPIKTSITELYMLPILTSKPDAQNEVYTYRVHQLGEGLLAITVDKKTGDIYGIRRMAYNWMLFRMKRHEISGARSEILTEKISNEMNSCRDKIVFHCKDKAESVQLELNVSRDALTLIALQPKSNNFATQNRNKTEMKLLDLSAKLGTLVASSGLNATKAEAFSKKESVGDIDEDSRRDYVCVMRSEMEKLEQDRASSAQSNRVILDALEYLRKLSAGEMDAEEEKATTQAPNMDNPETFIDVRFGFGDK